MSVLHFPPASLTDMLVIIRQDVFFKKKNNCHDVAPKQQVSESTNLIYAHFALRALQQRRSD